MDWLHFIFLGREKCRIKISALKKTRALIILSLLVFCLYQANMTIIAMAPPVLTYTLNIGSQFTKGIFLPSQHLEAVLISTETPVSVL